MVGSEEGVSVLDPVIKEANSYAIPLDRNNGFEKVALEGFADQLRRAIKNTDRENMGIIDPGVKQLRAVQSFLENFTSPSVINGKPINALGALAKDYMEQQKNKAENSEGIEEAA